MVRNHSRSLLLLFAVVAFQLTPTLALASEREDYVKAAREADAKFRDLAKMDDISLGVSTYIKLADFIFSADTLSYNVCMDIISINLRSTDKTVRERFDILASVVAGRWHEEKWSRRGAMATRIALKLGGGSIKGAAITGGGSIVLSLITDYRGGSLNKILTIGAILGIIMRVDDAYFIYCSKARRDPVECFFPHAEKEDRATFIERSRKVYTSIKEAHRRTQMHRSYDYGDELPPEVSLDAALRLR